MRIGVFEMAAADNYSVLFSPGTDDEDYVAADAVKVIKVSSGTAPSKLPESDASANTTGRDVAKEARTGESGSPRAVSASSKGQDVVKEARAYMGIPYRRQGVALRDGLLRLYEAGLSEVWRLAAARCCEAVPLRFPGLWSPQADDLVFFDEHGRGLSHVGIDTGKGTIVHASDYWQRVTETQIKYIKGYKGSKRLLG